MAVKTRMLKWIYRNIARLVLVSDRNTDADWKMIGENDPFYGVLTDDKFKRSRLNEASRSEFYASGVDSIGAYLSEMRRLFGEFKPESALDFGCGVGRLTVPLADVANTTVGVDISPGMLAEARQHERAGLRFQHTLPDGQFDWITSIIVLQHIPPERGYEILRQLLERVAPGGGVTIQLIFARAEEHENSMGARVVIGNGGARMVTSRVHHSEVPAGTMIVYDYDLSRVIALFYAAGIHRIFLDHCDHGGAIGATLFARKA